MIYEQVETVEDGTGKRLYVHPQTGAQYPSITTILSHFFSRKYKDGNQEILEIYKKRGAFYGNMLHNYAEQYVLNGNLPTDYTSKFMFNQIKPFIDESLSKVYFTERVVIDDETQTAGRLDLFGVWEGKDSIIDFKTSRVEKETQDIYNYFIQASFYAHCLNVDQIVILMTVEQLKNGKKWAQNPETFYPFFLKLREQYRLDNGI